MQNYLLIIPAYNEEGSIAGVIEDIRRCEKDPHILVINDGSWDKTADAAKKTGVMVISHPHNLGYAAALQTGYRFAVARQYDHVVIMDADGQHDARFISSLFKKMKDSGADVVIGTRFLEKNYHMSHARRLGVLTFSLIGRFYTGTKLTDPTSGFQLLNRKTFMFLAREECYPLDYPDINIIMLLHKQRFTIQEVPVEMRQTADSNSRSMHGGLKPVLYVIKMFLAIIIILLRKEK
jgi:glycosyltransferase involved in cell wall biosynthesis